MLPSNNGKSFKIKSRWLNRSEQDLPDVSGKSPTVAPAGSSTPIASNCNGDQMNDVSSSSLSTDQEKQLSVEQAAKEIVPAMPVFANIADNIYSQNERSKKSKDSKRMMCECTLPENGDDSDCCGSDCLNRLLYIECGPRCRCGDRCTNRRFQKHENAPVEPFPAGAKGWGLRAVASIRKNTFVMEYVGEVLNPKRFRLRIKQYAKDPSHQHHYFMALRNDEVIDATQKGNISRFINHSCQPNCETQKWTIDGRLRIGFFTVEDIEAGEELTFDYKFQRYGKEAQKCFCGTPACRGFIGGESSSAEASVPRREAATVRDVSKKKKEKTMQPSPFGDMLFDQELADLFAIGTLKNRDHVVTYCRLMVRAEEISARMQLLELLMNTNESCLRVFLDHHGCQLLWVWMADDQGSRAEWTTFQTAVLRILKRLPIPHRNMVEDSKLVSIVQRWAKNPISRLAKSKPSVLDDGVIIKALLNDLINQIAADETPGSSEASSSLNDDLNEQMRLNQEKEVVQLAEAVLAQWAQLKENFRIPKKNSGADRKIAKGENVSTTTKRDHSDSGKKRKRHDSSTRHARSRSPSPKHRHRRIHTRSRSRSRSRSRTRSRTRSRSRSRDGSGYHSRYPRRSRSPSRSYRHDYHSSKRKHEHKRSPDRLASAVVAATPADERSKKTKEERRREFEEAVLKQEAEEKQRMAVEAAQLHPVTYGVVGPAGAYWSGSAAPAVPSGTTAPSVVALPSAVGAGFTNAAMALMVYDANTSRHWWQEQVTKVLVYPADEAQVAAFARRDYSAVPHFYHDPATGLIHEVRAQIPLTGSGGADDLDEVDMACDDDQLPREDKIALLKEEIASLRQRLDEKEAELKWLLEHDNDSSSTPAEKDGPLPPGWKEAKDKEGNVYYYHNASKRTQWDHPGRTDEKTKPKDKDKNAAPTKRTERHSQKSKAKNHHLKRKVKHDSGKRAAADESKRLKKVPPAKKAVSAKVEEPSKIEEKSTPPAPEATAELVVVALEAEEKEVKQEELSTPISATASDLVPVLSTSNDAIISDPIVGHTPHGTTMAAADTSSEVARKLKESFKSQVSNYVVKYLSTYRKSDCKVGKIANTDDFKHLARKLTHAVMEKELKHCHRVEDLHVTESVLHKAKDYVKKYMAKVGSEYKRTNGSP